MNSRVLSLRTSVTSGMIVSWKLNIHSDAYKECPLGRMSRDNSIVRIHFSFYPFVLNVVSDFNSLCLVSAKRFYEEYKLQEHLYRCVLYSHFNYLGWE